MQRLQPSKRRISSPVSVAPWKSVVGLLFSLILILLQAESIQAEPPAFTESPRNRIFFWKVTSTTLAPDGVTRPVILVNEKYPGPRIEVNRGDSVTVVVENALDVPTSFHWHGLTMRDDPWYDGVPGMNQCPIPPGTNFTYAFGTDNVVGTHWWHAHFENQYIDGLVGAIIIQDPPETNPFRLAYDEERTIVISDWYHLPTGPLLAHYLSPESQGIEPVPNSGLINGKNIFDCSKVQPANLECNPGERSVFHFLPNRRYRLRLINSGAAAAFLFSIDEHKLQVIEVDGTDINPILVDSLPINTGQRYSVILTTNQEPKNYWMRAEMGMACLPNTPTNLDPIVLAEIRYQGGGKGEPTSVGRFQPGTPKKGDPAPINPAFEAACLDPDLYSLHPLQPQPLLEPISKSIRVQITFKADPVDNITRGYLNDITYAGNAWRPTILQNLDPVETFEIAQHVMKIDKRDSIVQIILENPHGGEHPFHLHGHTFQVIAQGQGVYEEGKTELNAINPLRRDTATIPRHGFAVIRFKADNPGVWSLHCHIEWHVTTGLVMQFVELPDELRALGLPKQSAKLCEAGPPKGFKAHTGFVPKV
ncbi:iron transport multicopper oxidase [Entomortierella parvispora]|uniref:Iron transport multicopper oxidase n=1 Tax=Entomortierella parvispora TaxID=205924 RepID=A0A9P3H5E6_9FUNG|nr:iron transport multicopper oxidase [Entomortierella parvispora]